MLRKAFTELLGATSDFWYDKNVGEVYSYDELEGVLIKYLKYWSLKTIVLDQDLIPLTKKTAPLKADQVLLQAIQGMRDDGELITGEQTLGEINKLTEADLKELQTALDNLKIVTYGRKAE